MEAVSIHAESPLQPAIQTLIGLSNAYSASLYPTEGRHPADLERLAAPDVRFFVARRGEVAIGCAALLVSAPTGEIKRMFVTSEARGLGIGQALLAALEQTAHAEGVDLLKLETGPRNAAALALYSAHGYQPCGAFPPYKTSPHSVFMEKPLNGA